MSDCTACGGDGSCGRHAHEKKKPFVYRRMTCYRDPRFRDEFCITFAADKDEAMRNFLTEFEFVNERTVFEVDEELTVTVVAR